MKILKVIILSLIVSVPVFSQSGAFGTTRADVIGIYNAGRDLESRGRTQEAETYYAQAVQACNNEINQNLANRDTYTALSWTLLRQRKYTEAVYWGERGLRIYTDEHRILEAMGEAYFYLNDYKNSLTFMQRYVNALPLGDRVSIAYFFMGEIYRLENKNRLADIAYTTAVRLQPAIALWWYRLGQVRENTGEISPASDAYDRALRLNPGYQAASEGLARVRRQSR